MPLLLPSARGRVSALLASLAAAVALLLAAAAPAVSPVAAAPLAWSVSASYDTATDTPASEDERSFFYRTNWASDPETRVPLTTAKATKLTLKLTSSPPKSKLNAPTTSISHGDGSSSSADDDGEDLSPSCFASLCLTHFAPLSRELERTTSVEFSWGLHCLWEARLNTNFSQTTSAAVETVRHMHAGPLYASVGIRYVQATAVAAALNDLLDRGRGNGSGDDDADSTGPVTVAWGSCKLEAKLEAESCDGDALITGGVGGVDCGLIPIPVESWPSKAAPLTLKPTEEALFEYLPIADYRASQQLHSEQAGAASDADIDPSAFTDIVIAQAYLNFTFHVPETHKNFIKTAKAAQTARKTGDGTADSFGDEGEEEDDDDDVDTVPTLRGYIADSVVPSLLVGTMSGGYDAYKTLSQETAGLDTYLSVEAISPRFSILTTAPAALTQSKGLTHSSVSAAAAKPLARLRYRGRSVATGSIDTNVPSKLSRASDSAVQSEGDEPGVTDIPRSRAFPLYVLLKNTGPVPLEIGRAHV